MAKQGKGWLIVDDLVDTGETAKALREMMPDAHFATVYAKPAGRPLVDTFVTEVSQDTWIFFPGTWSLNHRHQSSGFGARSGKSVQADATGTHCCHRLNASISNCSHAPRQGLGRWQGQDPCCQSLSV